MKTKNLLPGFIGLIFILLSLSSYSQLGLRNNGGVIKITDNAILKVNGHIDSANIINDTLNGNSPRIDLDGKIFLQGSWYNNDPAQTVFINKNDTGMVVFNGVDQQSINENPTSFENLRLDNTSGLILNTDVEVDDTLEFVDGILDVSASILSLGVDALVFGTPSASSMIAANNGGEVWKSFNANSSFTFPVGDNDGTNEYSPLDFTLNSNSGLTDAHISVSVTDTKHPNDTTATSYVTRYWTVNSSGITSPDYSTVHHYVDNDIVGDEAGVYNAKFDGATSILYGPADAVNNELEFNNLTSFSDFTGVAGLFQVTPTASGTWADQIGLTYDYTDVIIPPGIEILLQSGKATQDCNNLIIQPTGALTVSGTLNVTNDLTVESDATGQGSLIDDGTLNVTGQTLVEHYLSNGRWWYISPQIQNANAGDDLMVDQTTYELYYWKENNNGTLGDGWQEMAGADNLNPLQGYAYQNLSGTPITGNFIGNLNTGSHGSADNLTRSTGAYKEGFNLVGNPYPSGIDWGTENSPTTGLNKDNLLNTIWVRKDGVFATYNWSGDGTGTNGGTRYIAPGQAVWVRVDDLSTTGTYSLTNDTRVHHTTPPLKPFEANVFRLNANMDGENNDELAVGFYNTAEEEYEKYDSEKMFTENMNFAQIYTVAEGYKLAINGLPDNDEKEYIVPLGYRVLKPGDVTFEATNLDQFDLNTTVYLNDKNEEVMVNLRENNTYTFSPYIKGDNPNRFELIFTQQSTGIEQYTNEINIFNNGNTLYLQTGLSGRAHVKLIDMLGRTVDERQKELNPGLNGIRIDDKKPGAYIVWVKHNDQLITQKIILH